MPDEAGPLSSDQSPLAAARPAPQVHPVDFSRPSKFTEGPGAPADGGSRDVDAGAPVPLDRADADAPVDLYVNGRRLGTGTLLRVADSQWAIRIDSLDPC